MKMFGYLTVYFKVIFDNEDYSFGKIECDFESPITEDFFEALDETIRASYEKEYPELEIKEIIPVKKEDYEADEVESGIAYSWDETSFKEERF